jgi:hypothetical protein
LRGAERRLWYPEGVTERRRVRVDGAAPRRDQAPVAPDVQVEQETCDCARLDPADWHNVESDWSDIAFVRTSTSAVLGVPMGYDKTRGELMAMAQKAGGTIPEDAMLLMGSGRFRRPVMLEIEDPQGHKGVVRPGGVAFSSLVEAPWGQMQRIVDEATDQARERYGRAPDDVWVWYLTCRVCSKERNFETLIVAHYREAP